MVVATKTLFEYDHTYPISLYSFDLPGLSKTKGRLCGHQQMSSFTEEGDAVRYHLLTCKRLTCPTCWGHWARHAVFRLAMKIEGYARATGLRPFAGVFSIPPTQVKHKWSWRDVNTSLFRRGYRRSSKVDVLNGIGIFHPYRVKSEWKSIFRNEGITKTGGGYWKEIRRRVKEGEDLYQFIKLGPHVHAIMFGDPRAHACEDFLIRFKSEGQIPVPLSLEDIIGLLFYLITHTGVLNHLVAYKKHRGEGIEIRHKQTHTIRAWGFLQWFNPKNYLSESEYNELASEITTRIGMEWAADKNRMVYPASQKEFETRRWIPISKLPKYIGDDVCGGFRYGFNDFLNRLSPSQTEFWMRVLRFMRDGKGPPMYGDIKHPPDVFAVIDEVPNPPDEYAKHPTQITLEANPHEA